MWFLFKKNLPFYFAGPTNHRNMAIMNGGDTRQQNHHRYRENRLHLPGGKWNKNVANFRFFVWRCTKPQCLHVTVMILKYLHIYLGILNSRYRCRISVVYFIDINLNYHSRFLKRYLSFYLNYNKFVMMMTLAIWEKYVSPFSR